MINEANVRSMWELTGWEPAYEPKNESPITLHQKSIDEYIRVVKRHGKIQRINLLANCDLSTGTITRVTKVLKEKGIIDIERRQNGKANESWISLAMNRNPMKEC